MPDKTSYPTHYDHDGSPLVLGQGDWASPKPVEVAGVFAGALDEVRFSDREDGAERVSRAQGSP